MLRSSLMGLALALAMPGLAAAQSTEGRTLGETLFATIDTAGRGMVDMGEVENFRDLVFVGMDGNADRKVTYDEFASWDPGFAAIAQEAGRGDAYVTASKIIFAFWDRDGDGDLTTDEMRRSMSADFRRADLDDNAMLTQQEFITGFPIMVAMRAAIRPDL